MKTIPLLSIIPLSLGLYLMAVVVNPANALMSSSSYRLYADSIGTSGDRSSSTNYLLSDSIGEVDGEESSSTNYSVLAGFQNASEHPTFSFSIDASTVDLGTLSATAVRTATSTLTTSTNAPYGYSTTVVEDGDLRSGSSTIDDVSDGSVTSGSEEYGIALTGTDRAFADDRAITTSPLTVASRSNWKNGAETTVTYRASVASSTLSNTYSHTVTYISTGNY